MDSDSPKSVTQEGIAKAVDVGRNNVAKVLAEMSKEGTVDTFTRHVKGLPSVRKVYFLTPRAWRRPRSSNRTWSPLRWTSSTCRDST